MSLYEVQNYAKLIYGDGIEQMPVDERKQPSIRVSYF